MFKKIIGITLLLTLVAVNTNNIIAAENQSSQSTYIEYSYDANGNLKSKSIKSNKYSSLGFYRNESKVNIGNIGKRPIKGTIEFWMKSSDVQNYRNPLSTNGVGNTGIRFEQYSDGALSVVIGDDNGKYSGHFFTDASNLLNKDKWYHVAVVWDSLNNNVKGYLNGKQAFDEENTTWNTTFENLVLGNGFSPAQERWFKGELRELRIWSTLRTESQIKTEAFKVSSGANDLMGYWRMNEGFGLKINDLSGHDKNGTLQDVQWIEVN